MPPTAAVRGSCSSRQHTHRHTQQTHAATEENNKHRARGAGTTSRTRQEKRKEKRLEALEQAAQRCKDRLREEAEAALEKAEAEAKALEKAEAEAKALEKAEAEAKALEEAQALEKVKAESSRHRRQAARLRLQLGLEKGQDGPQERQRRAKEEAQGKGPWKRRKGRMPKVVWRGAEREGAGQGRGAHVPDPPDDAPEFINACSELKIPDDLSLPGKKQDNSLAERTNQFIVDQTTACLVHAGLPTCYWIYAITALCHLMNVEEINGSSAWFRLHGEHSKGERSHFARWLSSNRAMQGRQEREVRTTRGNRENEDPDPTLLQDIDQRQLDEVQEIAGIAHDEKGEAVEVVEPGSKEDKDAVEDVADLPHVSTGKAKDCIIDNRNDLGKIVKLDARGRPYPASRWIQDDEDNKSGRIHT